MILASASPTVVTLSAAAAVAYGIPALGAARLGQRSAAMLAMLAWLLHAAILTLALFVEPARFGFAPALSVTAWLVAAVYAIESQLYPQLQTRWALAVLGAASVLLALAFPGTALHANASAWLPRVPR